jgi:hypothetical protein
MSKKPTYKELEQKIDKLEKKVETFSKVDEILAESETKSRLLLKNLPGFVYKGFKDWSVEFTDNKVGVLTGYSSEEFNSKKLKWSDLILKEDIESVRESFIRALKTQESIESKPGREKFFGYKTEVRLYMTKRGMLNIYSGPFLISAIGERPRKH